VKIVDLKAARRARRRASQKTLLGFGSGSLPTWVYFVALVLIAAVITAFKAL
jgi:hypothetical protein